MKTKERKVSEMTRLLKWQEVKKKRKEQLDKLIEAIKQSQNVKLNEVA